MAHPIPPTLLIYTNNHFDQTWRRCWDRRFTFQGQTYASYADLEAYYMLDNLALAREHPEYKFEAESTIVVRKFLERHPEALEELVQLARDGRFAITGAGETIVDSNMILGESLVRNYVLGLLWIEEIFGRTPRLGVRNDAFGNSAQLPQILRGCEILWATGMTYTQAQGLYWRGLDGSVILHATLPVAAYGGGNTKYAPCPRCGGTGEVNETLCEACGGRGIDLVERAALPGPIDAEALESFGVALVSIAPEELLPNPDIISWADAQRDRYDVRFALEEEAAPYLETWIEGIESPEPADLHPRVELNPNNAGCWVTRIKTKQTCRRQEYALLGIETLAVMAAWQGASYPRETLVGVWRRLFFTMFHDAITATHVDPAYVELQERWREIDDEIAALRQHLLSTLATPQSDAITVLNLTGQASTQACAVTVHRPRPIMLVDETGRPVPMLDVRSGANGSSILRFVARDVPAFGARHYRLIAGRAELDSEVTKDPSGPVAIENQRFRVEADQNGITRIFDKALDRVVAASSTYRPAELILEHDEGSPWATLHPDQTRAPLGPHTRLVSRELAPAYARLTFESRSPWSVGFAGEALNATILVTLVKGIDRVDVEVRAHWEAFNHRLRLAMPVPFTGEPLYEIPYGALARVPYEPTFGWAGANGDWPAINWAGIEGAEASVALLNWGLPSYRIEHLAACEDSESQRPDAECPQGNLILVSLLRSPVLPTYLHEPQFYTMADWDGMRDAGDHVFHLALTAYKRPFDESTVVTDADAYNAGLMAVVGDVTPPQMPRVEADNVRISAVKLAERGDDLILRLHEYRGQGGEATIILPFPVTSAAKVNLLERQPEALVVEGECVRLTLRPWEIATLRVVLKSRVSSVL